MQSLKAETDNLFGSINRYEEITKEANRADEQHQADIRDLGKRNTGLQHDFLNSLQTRSPLLLICHALT